MTLYQTLLLVHVLGVILWLGGSVTGTLLLVRSRSAAPGQLTAQVENSRWIDLRMGMPSALVVLLAGGWLMAEGDWPFDTAIWIHIGFGALLAAAGIGAVWTGRYQRKLLEATGSDRLDTLTGKILLGNYASILLILIALWAMIAKPSVG
jgi:hypothetical protein